MKPDLWGGLGVPRTPPYPAAKRLGAETQVLGLRTRPEDVSPEQTWRLACLVLPSQAECVCFLGGGVPERTFTGSVGSCRMVCCSA